LRLRANLSPAEGLEQVFACRSADDEGGALAVVVRSGSSIIFAEAARDPARRFTPEALALIEEEADGPLMALVLGYASEAGAGRRYFSWRGEEQGLREVLSVATRVGPVPQPSARRQVREVPGARATVTVSVPGGRGPELTYTWSPSEDRFTVDRSSDLRVLFQLVRAEAPERVFAAPIACRRGGEWLESPLACVSHLPARPRLRTDAGGRLVGAEVTADDHGNTGIVVSGAGAARFAVYPARRRVPTVPCLRDSFEQEPVGVEADSVQAFEQLGDPIPEELRRALGDGRFTVDSVAIADFDGDGRADRWAAVEMLDEVSNGFQTAAIVARFGLSRTWSLVLFTSANGELFGRDPPSWMGDGYLSFRPSSCFDLDGDGRVEVLLARGGETERHYSYEVWRENRLTPVGFGLAFGD